MVANPDRDIADVDRVLIDRLLYAVYKRRISVAR